MHHLQSNPNDIVLDRSFHQKSGRLIVGVGRYRGAVPATDATL